MKTSIAFLAVMAVLAFGACSSDLTTSDDGMMSGDNATTKDAMTADTVNTNTAEEACTAIFDKACSCFVDCGTYGTKAECITDWADCSALSGSPMSADDQANYEGCLSKLSSGTCQQTDCDAMDDATTLLGIADCQKWILGVQ